MVSPVSPLIKYIEASDDPIVEHYRALRHDSELLKNNLGIDAPNGTYENFSGDLSNLSLINLSEHPTRQEKIGYLNNIRAELNALGIENQVHENLLSKAMTFDYNLKPEKKPVDALSKLTFSSDDKHYKLEDFFKKYAETLYDTALEHGFTDEEIKLRKEWYSDLDTFVPAIKGAHEMENHASELRQKAMQQLPINNYNSSNTENFSTTEIEAFTPETWSCILSFGYGDLHEWIEEENLGTKPGIQHEYSLDFLQPDIVTQGVLRPDAVEDLFIHEFKQPNKRGVPKKLDKLGATTKSEESDLQQINHYLNKMNLPLGFLVYLNDNAMKRYAIEKSDREVPRSENIHLADDYKIDDMKELLENNK